MGVDMSTLVGFGIEVDKKIKIYDSEDADYYEGDEEPDFWTADFEKFGLKYFWSEGANFVGIFTNTDDYDGIHVEYNYEKFAKKLKEAEIAFSNLAEFKSVFKEEDIKFYATTLYR